MKKINIIITTFLFSFFSLTTLFAAPNTWTQKTDDFGGAARKHAVGFSIGSKAYIGTGYYDVTLNPLNDFWEYDPCANTWTQKANFGGGHVV